MHIGAKALGSAVVAITAATAFAANTPPLPDPRQPQKCEAGHILTPFNPPGFDFAATSWYRAEKNAFIYRTCIENHADKPLDVNWIIPGPSGTVGKNDASVSPRPFTKHATADASSCLVYGNSRQGKMVQYIGHQKDLSRAGDCPGAQGKPEASASLLEENPDTPWFVADGRMSVPSNREDVDGTLIRFVYQIGLAPDSGRYNMILAYRAAPASPDGFRGNIKDITIRPSSDSVRRALMSSGAQDGIIRLSEYEGSYEIPMELAPGSSLQEQRYGFYDVSRTLVGQIYAPFLASGAPR
jgi:hypothetical protein